MSDLNLETTHVPMIGGTPYYGFAIMAHADMLVHGLVDPRDPLVNQDDGAVVARVGNDTVGVATYRYVLGANALWVLVVYVPPDWRRRRVFTHMFEELVKVAEKHGASRIELGTRPGNVAMKKAAEVAGMTLTGYLYSVDVEAE